MSGLLPGLFHGFSTNLSPGGETDFPSALEDLLVTNGLEGAPPPLLLEQPHSAAIYSRLNSSGISGVGGAAGREGGGEPTGALLPDGAFAGVDGALSGIERPLLLALRTADCLPVLGVDVETRSYGALHAGWRGVAAGILPNLLELWRGQGSSLEGVRLAIGPGIGPCCFEVRRDCLEAFRPGHLKAAVQLRGGATFLHLAEVLKRQAGEYGIAPERIETLPLCTCCHGSEAEGHPFASYRRSRKRGEPGGSRNASFIGILSP